MVIKKDKPPKVKKIKIKDPNKPKRFVSAETRAKISEKRRARTVQPRNCSQSSKRKNFYGELLNDYRKNSEAIEWIKKNKKDLGGSETYIDFNDIFDASIEAGIYNEFTTMYRKINEIPVCDVLFDDPQHRVNDTSLDPYYLIDKCDLGYSILDIVDEEEVELYRNMEFNFEVVK